MVNPQQPEYVDPPAGPKADALNVENANVRVADAFDTGGHDSSAGATALKPQSALVAGGQDQAGLGEAEYKIAAAQQPILRDLEKAYNTPHEAAAKYEKIKEEPKPEDYHKYSMEFASAAAVLGAISGRWTRQGGTASLNAFAGALKGWQQGNLQAYEEASKQWEQDTKKTIENNNIELEKYKEILNDRKLNIEEMTQHLTIAGYEAQNSVVVDMGTKGDFNGIAQMVDKFSQANQRYQSAYGTLSGVRNDQKADELAQIQPLIETYNSDPELNQRVKQQDPAKWAQLRARGAVHGIELQQPPEGTVALPKVSANPRSLPAMWAQSFTQDFQRQHGRLPRPDELSDAAAGFRSEQSAAGALGTFAGQIGGRAQEFEDTLPLARQASKNFPRGEFVPFNELRQMGAAAYSDPKYKQFMDATEASITAFGAAISRSGGNTVHAQQRAHKMLDTADSDEAYQAGLDQLEKEVKAIKGSPGRAAAGVRESLKNPGAAPAAGDGNIPPPPPGFK